MENSKNENFIKLNLEEMIHTEAGSLFWDLGRAVAHGVYNYLDDIASGKIVATHSGMGAYSVKR